jgi:hypothetical protein
MLERLAKREIRDWTPNRWAQHGSRSGVQPPEFETDPLPEIPYAKYAKGGNSDF